MKRYGLIIAATLSFLIMILVNVLANVLPINGLTTGDVADLYPNLFTPAGVTFSIWSIIYLALASFLGYSWLKKSEVGLRTPLKFFVGTCVLNISWILLWHHLFPLMSVFVMLALLFTLGYIFVWLQRIIPQKGPQVWFVKLPFSLYFSWITVATIANISAYLVSTGWNGFNLSEEFWTVTMLAIASLIALIILRKYGTPVVVAVLLWTLTGVFLKWRSSEYETLITAVYALAVALVIITIVTLRRKATT